MEHPWDMEIQMHANEIPSVKKWPHPREHSFIHIQIITRQYAMHHFKNPGFKFEVLNGGQRSTFCF